MTKLSDIVRDEVAQLRQGIENFPVEGCIIKYADYLESSNHEGFEKEFVIALTNNVKRFVTNLLRKRYETYDKERLLNIVMEWQVEGPYCLDCQFDNDSLECIFSSYFTDIEIHEDIKKEMNTILDMLVEQARTTKAEKEKKKLEADVQALKNTLKNSEDAVSRLAKSLEEAEERLKNFK